MKQGSEEAVQRKEMHLALKYIKRSSKLITGRETQIEMIMTCHFSFR